MKTGVPHCPFIGSFLRDWHKKRISGTVDMVIRRKRRSDVYVVSYAPMQWKVYENMREGSCQLALSQG